MRVLAWAMAFHGLGLDTGQSLAPAVSYNPGYQNNSKSLTQSTRKRFAALEFDYPAAQAEADIVAHEAGIDRALAVRLVDIAHQSRRLRERGLDEGISTRMLIYAGVLIRDGLPPIDSCRMAMTAPITDDPDMQRALGAILESAF